MDTTLFLSFLHIKKEVVLSEKKLYIEKLKMKLIDAETLLKNQQ